jgi:hypothetical protein
MNAGSRTSSGDPVALSALLDTAAQCWASPSARLSATDGILFSGNRHESVPRALLLDRRLTPLERNAWQVFRLRLNDDGITAFPTYEQLRPYLASMPCVPHASHETVARALTLLRLTRWLSLVRRRRDPKTGRIQGNLYVLHDEPLTPFEAMQLDPEYLGLVSHALAHASKAIQRVGVHVLREIADDPLLAGRALPTRLQILTQRLGGEVDDTTMEGYPQEEAIQRSEAGESPLLRKDDPLPSDSEAGAKAASAGVLPNPKRDRTVRSNRIKEVRTVPRARTPTHLRLPERFVALIPEQQSGALVALQQVDVDVQQAVLDEWSARCKASTVRHPAGYLFGIIQKAIRGEFKAWASQLEPVTPRPPASSATPPSLLPASRSPADDAVAQEHIARLRAMLHLP